MFHKTKYGMNRIQQMHCSLQSNIKCPPIFALVTDLDHTLIGQHGDYTHEQCNGLISQFNELWLQQYAPNNCVLVYATGRNFQNYQRAVQEWDILKPDILVSQDGVNIHWFNQQLARYLFDEHCDEVHEHEFVLHDASWQSVLQREWNQELAQQIHDEIASKFELLPLPQGGKSIEPYRIGVVCKGYETSKEVEAYINQRVHEHNEVNKDEAMKVHTFTGAERYQEDAYWSTATPITAGKGAAIEFVRKRLSLSEERIVCIGDSGNDISMMQLSGVKSVVVSNASHELLHFYEQCNAEREIWKTTQPNTLGVIEGLQHYGREFINP